MPMIDERIRRLKAATVSRPADRHYGDVASGHRKRLICDNLERTVLLSKPKRKPPMLSPRCLPR